MWRAEFLDQCVGILANNTINAIKISLKTTYNEMRLQIRILGKAEFRYFLPSSNLKEESVTRWN